MAGAVSAGRAAGPAAVPIPAGFAVRLDVTAKQLTEELWFGGSPARVVRLTPAGRRAWRELAAGPVSSRAAGLLARRLTDAGIAHPVPPAPDRSPDLTVVVPAFGRPDDLAACLAALGRDHPVIVVDDGSREPAAIAATAAAHGATLLRHDVNRGPGAARNTGLAAAGTRLVAFVDSDARPGAAALDALAAHLADPLVVAAAPRITALVPPGRAGRYTTVAGSLDLGPLPGRVAPGTRVSYVPTATLVARRDALGAGFDPALRLGEDVDLVWRLVAAGGRIRYDPAVTVPHREPVGWAELLRRRFRYGTSAGPLGRRHPDAVAPLVLHPWPALVVAALLARRPLAAAAGFGAALADTARLLRRAGVPTAGLVPATARAVQQTWLGVGRYATQFAAPPVLLVALRRGPAGRRLAAASLLLGPALTAWRATRPEPAAGRAAGPAPAGPGPAGFVAARLADDLAYGSGVWAGCLRERTLRPVRPTVRRRPLRVETNRS